MSQQSMTTEGTGTASRRSATRNKKGGCFVGVVRLDELSATNGACLPEQIRRTHSGGNVNMDNATFLRQHAVSTPTGGSSSMPASADYSSNTLTSNTGPMHHQPQPYGVPSNFDSSGFGSLPAPNHRSSSMVVSGSTQLQVPNHRSSSMIVTGSRLSSMMQYQDIPNQNGKRPSMAMSMSVTDTGSTEPTAKKGRKLTTQEKPKKRWTWKKPKGMPKRPLSAYNLFFATERKRIVAEQEAALAFSAVASPATSSDGTTKRIHRRTHGKISFTDLARTIGDRWKALPDADRTPFKAEAAKDKARYDRDMVIYKMKKDIETKKVEQKRLEEMIAATKSGSGLGDTDHTQDETIIPEEQSEPSVYCDYQGPLSNRVDSQQQQNAPSPTAPPQGAASLNLPRINSFGLLSLGLLDDDLGFGHDSFVASLNNSRNLDTPSADPASSLAQAALDLASQTQDRRSSPPPSRSALDMLLEGISEDRDMMTIGNHSFTFNNSFSSTNSGTKKVTKTGASAVGEVCLATPNVPLLHSATAANNISSGSNGNGGEDRAYSDSQLVQDIIASIEADERSPSSLVGGTGDLVGNFVLGSAA